MTSLWECRERLYAVLPKECPTEDKILSTTCFWIHEVLSSREIVDANFKALYTDDLIDALTFLIDENEKDPRPRLLRSDDIRVALMKDYRQLLQLEQSGPDQSPQPNPTPLPPSPSSTDARATLLTFPTRRDDDQTPLDPVPVTPQPWLSHREYCATPHWHRVSTAAKKAGDYRCALCGRTDRPVEAHHNTYLRLWRELLRDITLLCDLCHALFHRRLPKLPVSNQKKAA